MVFVDTGAWFAFFVPSDPAHARVRDWLAEYPYQLVTTDYCVDETLTLLVARGELRRGIEAGRAFFETDIARLHFVTVEQIQRAWLVFRQRAAAGWSFTDCTSKVVIDDMGLSEALALDEHFRQFGNVLILP